MLPITENKQTRGESRGWVQVVQASIIFPLDPRATREQHFEHTIPPFQGLLCQMVQSLARSVIFLLYSLLFFV